MFWSIDLIQTIYKQIGLGHEFDQTQSKSIRVHS